MGVAGRVVEAQAEGAPEDRPVPAAQGLAVAPAFRPGGEPLGAAFGAFGIPGRPVRIVRVAAGVPVKASETAGQGVDDLLGRLAALGGVFLQSLHGGPPAAEIEPA